MNGVIVQQRKFASSFHFGDGDKNNNSITKGKEINEFKHKSKV